MCKKLKFSALVLIGILLSINQMWGTTLTENFYTSSMSGNTYGANNSLSTNSNRSSFNYTWGSGTGTVFKNGIKLGSGSATGSTTCSNILSDIPVGTAFTVKVYAAVWGTDGGKVKITYNSVDSIKDAANSAISSPNNVTYNASHFTNATTFQLTRVKDVVNITLSSTNKRLIVDKVEIVYSSGYTVDYVCNGAMSGCPSQATGQTALPNPLPTPTKTGSTFEGWYTDSGFETAAVAGATLTGAVTLYAKWCKAPTSVTITSDAYQFYPGEAIELTAAATGSPEGSPVTYQWQHNGVDVGTNSNTYSKAINTTTAADAGSYTCTISYGSCSTSSGYNLKCMQFYLKNSSGVDISNHALTKVDATHATLSLNLTGGTTYKFRVTDGCNNWYGNSGEMTSSNCTDWHMDADADCRITTGSKTASYTFNFDFTDGLLGTQMKVSVVYPSSNQASGKVIYWDNEVNKWDGSKLWYRIGKSTHNSNTKLTKVAGTANLYSVTTGEYNGFDYWHIANNEGNGNGNIFWTKGDAAKAITAAMGFEGTPVTDATVTVTPTSSHSTGSGDNSNCEFYTYSITTGIKNHTVTSSATNCTVTMVKYTNDAGTTTEALASGGTVKHTQYIKVTVTPNTGYEFGSVTVTNGETVTAAAAGTPGVYYITGNATVTATCNAKTTTVTLDNQSATTAGAASVTATYGQAVPSIAANLPDKTGYTFGGYYTLVNGGGTKYINANGSSAKNWDIEDATKILYAQWSQKNYTVTLNDGSGSGGDGTVSVTYDSDMNIDDVTVPTYAGNDFRGYYTAASGGGTKVIDGAGKWITGTAYVDAGGNWVYDGSPTLYAYWTATTYNNYRTSCSTTAKVITINNLTGGTVTTSPSGSAEPDDVVTITLAADTHYNIGGAPTVVDEDDNPVSISGSGSTYTFTMPDKDVTVTPAAWSPINVTIYWHRKTGTTPEEVLEGTSDKTFPNTTDVDAECAPFAGWIAGTTWADSYDAPATTYAAGATVPTVNADVHYTAIYREKVTAIAPAYVKMTAAPKSWINDHYLIVYEGAADRDSVAFDGRRDNDTYGNIDAAYDTVRVKIVDDVIAKTARLAAAEWKIDTLTDGKHSIQSASGFYIGQTSDANGMLTNKSTTYQNTLAYSSGSFSVTSSGAAVLRYNKAADQLRFRYYKSDKYSSQQVIQLYKLGEAEVNTYTYTKSPACTPRYRVTVPSVTGGVPSADPIYTPADSSVTLTANPAAGYSFTGWTLTHTDGGAAASVTYTTGSASTATAVFTMPEYDLTATASYAKIYVTSVEAKEGETTLNTTTNKLELKTGANKTVTVVVTPADAFDHSWSAEVTSGGTCASISNVADGSFRVNGLAAGTATIVVTAPNDDQTDKTTTFTVEVTDVLPEAIILKRDGSNVEIDALTAYVGQYVKVNVSYSPTPTNKDFTFATANDTYVSSHAQGHTNPNYYVTLNAKKVTTSPINCTFTSSADGTVTKVLAVTVVPLLTDTFVDYIQGKATQYASARLSTDNFNIYTDITTPSLTDASDANPTSPDCETSHYHLIGWLPAATAEALWAAGTPITDATEGLVKAGVQVEATGQTWYAIWAEEAE